MEGKEIILSTLNNKILKKTILEVGDNSSTVLEGAECELEITNVSFVKDYESGAYNGEVLRSDLFSEKFDGKWIIGNATSYIDADVERCLLNMYLFETSKIVIVYCNTNNEQILTVSFEVSVLNVCNSELLCDWEWTRKLTYARRLKVLGKDLITKGRIIEGFRKFSRALKVLLTLDKTEDLEKAGEDGLKEINKMKIDLYNNLAYCQLQYNEFQAVVDLSNKALDIDNTNEKALYRRGCGLMGLEDYEAAYADICQVLAVYPNNAAAKSKAAKLREKVKHVNDKYKKVIKSMFPSQTTSNAGQ